VKKIPYSGLLLDIIEEKIALGKKTPKDHPDKVANSAKFH